MPGEADPTASPGASDTDDKLKGGEADPTAKPGATDTDGKTRDDDTKKGESFTQKDIDTAVAAALKAVDSKGGDGDTDWEARFKGLQPKYTGLAEDQKEWEKTRLQLNGQIAENQTALETAKTTIDTLTADAEKSKSGGEELQSTIDKLEVQLERQTLIMSDFPQLAVLEGKGLLPTDVEGDALKTALDNMSEVLQTEAIRQTGLKLGGSTGDLDLTTGKRSQGDDIGSLTQKIMEANAKGDAAEAGRLTSLLIDAQNKKFLADGVTQPADVS